MKKWHLSDSERKTKDLWQLQRINSEFTQGFDKMFDIKPGITVFGSARFKKDNKYYKATYNICSDLTEMGYTITTGGGPGIMEAANKAAKDNKVDSIGIGIELPFEAGNNEYVDYDKSLSLKYFFTRKLLLTKYSQGFLCMPGGLGTLDELAEVLTLSQTGKTQRFPIVLYDSKYWKGLLDWFKDTLLDENATISEKDFDLFRVVDTKEEAVKCFTDFFNKYRVNNEFNVD